MSADESKEDTEHNKNTLPEGWEKCFSVRKNKVYYFHAESGHSSWTFPDGTTRSEKSYFGAKQDKKLITKMKRNKSAPVDGQKEYKSPDVSPSKRKRKDSKTLDPLLQTVGQGIEPSSTEQLNHRKDDVLQKMLKSEQKLKKYKQEFEKHYQQLHDLTSCEKEIKKSSNRSDNPASELEEGEIVSEDESKPSQIKSQSDINIEKDESKKRKYKKKKKSRERVKTKEERTSIRATKAFPKNVFKQDFKTKVVIPKTTPATVSDANILTSLDLLSEKLNGDKNAHKNAEYEMIKLSTQSSSDVKESITEYSNKTEQRLKFKATRKLLPTVQPQKSSKVSDDTTIKPVTHSTNMTSEPVVDVAATGSDTHLTSTTSQSIESQHRRKLKAKRSYSPRVQRQKESKLVAIVTSIDASTTNSVTHRANVTSQLKPAVGVTLAGTATFETNMTSHLKCVGGVTTTNTVTPQTNMTSQSTPVVSSKSEMSSMKKGQLNSHSFRPFHLKVTGQPSAVKQGFNVLKHKNIIDGPTKTRPVLKLEEIDAQVSGKNEVKEGPHLTREHLSTSNTYSKGISNNSNIRSPGLGKSPPNLTEGPAVSRLRSNSGEYRHINVDKRHLFSNTQKSIPKLDSDLMDTQTSTLNNDSTNVTLNLSEGLHNTEYTEKQRLSNRSPGNVPTAWQFQDGHVQVTPDHRFREQMFQKWGSCVQARNEEEMDTDLCEISVTRNASQTQGTFVVIDTNVLMGDIKYFKLLLKEQQPGVRYVNIVLPWPVFQELDGIKMCRKPQNKDSDLGQFHRAQNEARAAIDYLNKLLESKHPRLYCQTPKQCQESARLPNAITVEITDDKMLNCYIQWQQMYPDHSVLFLSNDKNLRNKALISDIPAFSVRSLQLLFEREHVTGKRTPSRGAEIYRQSPSLNLVRHVDSMDTTFQPIEKPISHHTGHITPTDRSGRKTPTEKISCQSMSRLAYPCTVANSSGANRCSNSTNENAGKENDLVDEIYGTIAGCVAPLLKLLLESEMKKVYGDIWKTIMYIKPPWSLLDTLQCLQKHWIAVFGFVFPRDVQQTIDSLVQLFTDEEYTLRHVSKIINNMLTVCQEIQNLLGVKIKNIPKAIDTLRELSAVIKHVDLGNILPLEQEQIKISTLKKPTEKVTFLGSDLVNRSNCNKTGAAINGERGTHRDKIEDPAIIDFATRKVENSAHCDQMNDPAIVAFSLGNNTVINNLQSSQILQADSIMHSNVDSQSTSRSTSVQDTEVACPAHFQVLGKGIVYYQQQFMQALEKGLLGPERQELIKALAILCANLWSFCNTYERITTDGLTSQTSEAMSRITNRFAEEIKIQQWQNMDEDSIQTFFGDNKNRTACQSGLQELKNMLSNFQKFDPFLSQEEKSAIENFTKTYAVS